MSQTILYLIIGILLFNYFLDRILNYLNQKNWSSKIPSELSGLYDDERYAKSQEYQKVKDKFSFYTSTFSLILMLTFLLLGGFASLDELIRGNITEEPIALALLFFGILGLASDIVSLPFQLYSIFVIEERFGFNKMTLKIFLADKVKGYLLSGIIGGILLALIVWIYLKYPEQFWLIAWAVLVAFMLLATTFYASVIVPLFNKLTPLEEGSLRTKIETYCTEVKFKLKDLFIMDGSKRSSKANAFFSGLGPQKRIVLFDTLVEKHSEEELVAVLAHEIGHYKKKHTQWSLILSILQTGIMFFILNFLINSPELPAALGSEIPSFHLSLVAFGLLYTPISMIMGIAMKLFSRKNEYEADAFARTTYSAEPLMIALKKMSVDHLSNLTPHPAYVFFHYTHPTLLQRLRALTV